MADVPAHLVFAYYEIPQAAAGAYDRERKRSIPVPGPDADGPIAGASRERTDPHAASRDSPEHSKASAPCRSQ